MKRHGFAAPLFLAAWSFVSAAAAEADTDIGEQIRALNWVAGPADVAALQNATIQLPGHYVFLDNTDAKAFMRLTENIPGDAPEQIFGPEDLHWWAFIEYSDDGYVKDQEELDIAAILESIKQGTEQGNEERRKNGWPEMHVIGWRHVPHYDTATKRLEWALDGKDSDRVVATNFQTRVLGRRGVTSITLVTDPEHVEADIGEFKSVLAGYRFNPGDTYAEFKPGDKVATYGLAALILGGGAAVAAKSGLLKFLGKFIWVGLAAVALAAKRLFKRRA
jgi:uncharacterized membrane-anchored protein